MKIITISREFGSGGRELGSRLAADLGFDYYDREIIAKIATSCGVNEEYADYVLSNNFTFSGDVTYGQSFRVPDVMQTTQLQFLREQTNVIRDLAKLDRDFVIVGRNADLILKEHKPFNVFVCADQESKLARCLSRKQEDEEISEKEMLRTMKQIDKNRARTRSAISDNPWGDRQAYHLIVNTSGWEIQDLIPCVKTFAAAYFNK